MDSWDHIFIVNLVGVMVLSALFIRLRRRAIPDWILWLTLGLLCWVVVAGMGLFVPHGGEPWVGGYTNLDVIAYSILPLSTLAWVIAGFRFSPVVELLSETGIYERKNRKYWIGLSLLFLLSSYAAVFGPWGLSVGRTVDATLSALSMCWLAVGLFLTFRRYEHLLLSFLSVFAVGLFVAMQVYRVGTSLQDFGQLARGMSLVGNDLLVLLFVALAIAWSQAEATRQSFRSGRANVDVIALCFDLRRSTSARERHDNPERFLEFMNGLRQWAVERGEKIMGARPSMTKFLGDGYLVVWELPSSQKYKNAATRLCLELNDDFATDFRSQYVPDRIPSESIPECIGVSFDYGIALRLIYENGSFDYVGNALNMATKFQAMARPNGGVVLAKRTKDNIDAELAGRLTVKGLLQFESEDEGVEVFGTERVTFATTMRRA